MDKLIKNGRLMFAIGIIALGALCIISKNFIVGRPPGWAEAGGGNLVLGYVTGVALVIAAIAIIFNKGGGLAAILIAVIILVLSVFGHLAHFMDDWLNAYKSMALFGGS